MTTQTLNPSLLTGASVGQINKVKEIVGASMSKGSDSISRDLLQDVLGNKSTSKRLVYRTLQTISDYVGISREVIVDYDQDMYEMVKRAGMKISWTQQSALNEAYQYKKGKKVVEFVFFKPGYYIDTNQVLEEMKVRHLTFDAHAQVTANVDDQEFIRHHPNSYFYENSFSYEGVKRFYSFTFRRYEDCTKIFTPVWEGVNDYPRDMWFGGVRNIECTN